MTGHPGEYLSLFGDADLHYLRSQRLGGWLPSAKTAFVTLSWSLLWRANYIRSRTRLSRTLALARNPSTRGSSERVLFVQCQAVGDSGGDGSYPG
jgi:hypothetical protein